MQETTDWYAESSATFGDRVAGARETLGLNQGELARRLGVNTTTLQAWEDDRAEPRANRLQILSGILNVSLKWLLTGEGEGVAPPGTVAKPDAGELLIEMRQLQGQLRNAAERMAVLEKRLKSILEHEA